MSSSGMDKSWINIDLDPESENFDENEAEKHLKEMEEKLVATDDLYATLNVSRNASEDEIKDAHRHLSRMFHPDKQTDSELRESAQEQFHRIQRAYEILIDPKTRAIYDNFGEEGLKAKLDIGQRFKTAAEMRKEFEEEAARKYQKEVENLIRAKGNFTMQVDATQAVSEVVQDELIAQGQSWDPIPRVRMMALKHSVESQILPNIGLNLVASMVTKGKNGSGNLLGTLRYTHSPQSTFSVGLPLINPRKLILKSSFRPTSDTFYNIESTLKHNSLPAAVFTTGKSVKKNMTAFMSVQTGNEVLHSLLPEYSTKQREKSSATIGITGVSWKSNYNAQVTASARVSNISFSLSRDLDTNFKLNGGLMVAAAGSKNSGLAGLAAISTHVGGTAKITETTSIGWTTRVSLPNGIQLNLNFSHLGQTLSLPILLSPIPEPDIILLAAALPAIVGVGLHYTVFRPRRKRQLKQRIDDLKESQQKIIELRKKDAEHAVKLMKETIKRRKDAELRDKGLVIVRAVYGDIDSSSFITTDQKLSEIEKQQQQQQQQSDAGPIIDVSIPLQSLVYDKHLVLPGGISKSQLIGFYDPCFGSPKKLHIEYLFRGEKHCVTIKDNDPVAIPLRGHLINNRNVSP